MVCILSTLIEKKWQSYLAKLFPKRAILQHPCKKTSVVKSVFNKITKIDCRPAASLKTSFQQGNFPVKRSEFSATF